MRDETLPRIMNLRAPDAPQIPLVFDSPHSGYDYPEDFNYQQPLKNLRASEDTFIDELYSAAPEIGAALLRAFFPRIYIDLNRSETDMSPDHIVGETGLDLNPGPKTHLGLGLIWQKCFPNLPLYSEKLAASEVLYRIEKYHRPYHNALKHELDMCHQAFGAVWHINCHSMPAISGEMSEEGPGIKRADFVLGDRDGTTCSGEFTEFVRSFLSDLGYHVTVNDPYKGAELVRVSGDPANNRHSLQIEINRGLYMDEDTFERSDGFENLHQGIDKLVSALSDYTRKAVQQ